jgi:Tfp pilus assembly protein PilX
MTRRSQRGSTLVVTLLFLILMSMFAISGFNTSSANLRVVGNMQARQESTAAAQAGVENTISSIAFTTNSEAVAATPFPVDINGDGSTDYRVRMVPKPNCFRVRPIKSAQLETSKAADLACMRSGVVQNSGLESPDAASSSGNSMCSQTEWNIRAEVADTRTGAKVAVNQGVAVRVLETDAHNSCV